MKRTRSRSGSVYRKADGKGWIARLRFTDASGRACERKRVCKTYREAVEMIALLKAESGDQRPALTMTDLISFYQSTYVHSARYVDGQKVSGFRQPLATINYYLANAERFFFDKLVADVQYSDVERFRAWLFRLPKRNGGQRSIADVNQHLRKLRRVFSVAIEHGWLNVSPFARGRGLIITSAEIERATVISVSDEIRLLEVCVGRRAHLRPLIIFAIETAARRNELLSLTWNNVDIERRIITLSQGTTKVLRERSVPISRRLAATIADMRINRLFHPATPVFQKIDFKRAWRTATRAAGLDGLRFHDLRHTAITRMIDAGISPPIVMKISGHSQQKTFLRYVNPSDDSLALAADALDAAALHRAAAPNQAPITNVVRR